MVHRGRSSAAADRPVVGIRSSPIAAKPWSFSIRFLELRRIRNSVESVVTPGAAWLFSCWRADKPACRLFSRPIAIRSTGHLSALILADRRSKGPRYATCGESAVRSAVGNVEHRAFSVRQSCVGRRGRKPLLRLPLRAHATPEVDDVKSKGVRQFQRAFHSQERGAWGMGVLARGGKHHVAKSAPDVLALTKSRKEKRAGRSRAAPL